MIADGERLGRWAANRLAVDDTDAWCEAAGIADLVWIESPSNPLFAVADLRRISSAPRAAGWLLAVDNTLAGPLSQQPLDLGVDVAVQSATKHLGGYSDLLCESRRRGSLTSARGCVNIESYAAARLAPSRRTSRLAASARTRCEQPRLQCRHTNSPAD